MPRHKRAPKEPRAASDAASPNADQRDSLTNVTPKRNESNTDMDIIGIHGLDTKSPETWTWKSRCADPDVNWLADPHMLPSKVENARIFTYDWHAQLFQDSSLTQISVDQHAAFLLHCIRRELFSSQQGRATRPILFIASCLGGLILAKALILADNSKDDILLIRQATGAVVFLGTPFRGTSFEYVAKWAKVGLNFTAVLQDKTLSKLINLVDSPTHTLRELIMRFSSLCQDAQYPIELYSFFELKKTCLQRKALPFLPKQLFEERLLVDDLSASLDIMGKNPPLGLMRAHSLMNKFMGPECGDYKKVWEVIQSAAVKVWQQSPLHQADAAILENNYAEKELEIVRLSGESLSMSQCYINLAIVRSLHMEEDNHDVYGISGLSFTKRQELETPDAAMQVDLASLFNERDGKAPRRILIRGRAGMGKTTLCKKIIHEFYHRNTELRKSWAKIFDRILWIPLRNLKERSINSFDQLFFHGFFEMPQERRRLAEDFSRQWQLIRGKTLFLLDGLDEILPDLVHDKNAGKFLRVLLDQENVIITSRPSASVPSELTPLHLDLEVIGFYPDQVKSYVKFFFTRDGMADDENINSVLEFLDEHWLMQSLMRIPIQLDALCFTWSDWAHGTNAGAAPETMTAVYKLMEEKLWFRDFEKMEVKDSEGQVLTRNHVSAGNIRHYFEKELRFLALVAFSGLHDNMIIFDSQYQECILTKLGTWNFSYAKQLPRVSFLRVLNPKSEIGQQKSHFIHLTFQEYFAAKYFVERWRDPCTKLDIQGLAPCSARDYLGKYKYSPRYDVFWRFVAGLLDNESEMTDFLLLVEQEPFDLIGAVHQRLIMRLLSEMPRELEIRSRFEQRLKDWVLFEFSSYTSINYKLCAENEFPEAVLHSLLQQDARANPVVGAEVCMSLSRRAYLTPRTFNIILSETIEDHEQCSFACRILSGPAPLPREAVCHLVKHLGGNNVYIRVCVLQALSTRDNIPDDILAALLLCLRDPIAAIRWLALQPLGHQATLPNSTLTAIASYLDDPEIRVDATEALMRHSCWSDDVYTSLTILLNDAEEHIRAYAAHMFRYPKILPQGDKFQMLLVDKLADENAEIRNCAAGVFYLNPSLSAPIVGVIKDYIRSGEPFRQAGAISSLTRDQIFTDELFDDLATLMKTGNCHVQESIASLLPGLKVVPSNIWPVLLECMGNANHDVRGIAIPVLMARSDLPKAVERGLTAYLKHKDSGIRLSAARVLGERSKLFDEAFEWLVDLLEDDDMKVVAAAIRAICKRPNLSVDLCAKISQLIAALDDDLKNDLFDSLRNRTDLAAEIRAAILGFTPEGGFDNILKCVEGDISTSIRVMEALETCSHIPENVLVRLSRCLPSDFAKYAEDTLLRILFQQSNLPEHIFEHLISVFDDVPAISGAAQHGGNPNFISWLVKNPDNDKERASKLFIPLLRDSYRGHMIMYIQDSKVCLESEEGIKRYPVEDGIAERLKSMRAELPAGGRILAEGEGRQ